MSRLERIVAACGGILLDGGARALIPGPDHSHKDRSVSLAETEEGRILIHCFSPRDDWRQVRDALRARGLLDRLAATDKGASRVVLQPDNEERRARAERLWNESRAIRCTPASAYIKRRGLHGVESAELRLHPHMTSVDDRMRRPALMAAIRSADGALQGVQATLLSAYGASKALVATPRRVIGKLLGGAVQLRRAGDTLVIAEGVESALSAASALGVPSWAALSAHNLSLFKPPPGVSRLIVAPDNDAAGLRAWDMLQERLSGGTAPELAMAPDGANDWNDWARAQSDTNRQ